MGRAKLTEERFLKEVANHKLTVHRDDGLYRHIRIGRPQDSYESFHIHTWPGHLCYTGDMGTFVFQRMEDMFEFFRGKKPNLHYWAEKVEGVDRHSGLQEFSMEQFEVNVRRRVLSHYEEAVNAFIEEHGEAADPWDAVVPEEVRDALFSVLNASDEWEAVTAIRDFEETDGLTFDDFWEADPKVYTGRYRWACFAIPHAIKLYDEHKAASQPAPPPPGTGETAPAAPVK